MNDDSNDDFEVFSQFLAEYAGEVQPQNTIGSEVAPPINTHAIGDPANNVQRSSDRMEPYGYYYNNCDSPDQELVERIKSAFYGGSVIAEGPTTHVKRERICEEFIQSGVKEPIEDIVQKALGDANYIIQGPVIVGHNPRPEQLGPKMAHPVKDAISLLRVVDGSLNPGQGAFNIYPTTHHLSPEEFRADSVPRGQPAMDPKKLFVIRGGTLIDIVPPEGCLLVWIGYSVRPMFKDQDKPGTFPFMTSYEYVELPRPGSVHNYKRKI